MSCLKNHADWVMLYHEHLDTVDKPNVHKKSEDVLDVFCTSYVRWFASMYKE